MRRRERGAAAGLLLSLGGVALLAVGSRCAGFAVAPQVRASWRRDLLFPDARTFLAKVQMLRIGAALRAHQPQRALRHARDALLAARDLPALRVHLAEVFAVDLPPLENDVERRLAWIAEGLRILDEGIAADPDDARLRERRGVLLWDRGLVFPEFAEAWRRSTGRSTLDAAIDDLLAAVRLDPDAWRAARFGAIALQVRGDLLLDAASAADDAMERAHLASRARADHEGAIALLEHLLRTTAGRAFHAALEEDVAYGRERLAAARKLE